MRIETTEKGIFVYAENGNVLCDGSSMSSVNGRVSAPPGADVSGWVEMSEAAAEALCAQNSDEEISDEELGAMVREVL